MSAKCRHTAKRKGPRMIPRPFFVPKSWQEREDSNPRPLVLETSALARLSYAPAMFGALLMRHRCLQRFWNHIRTRC